MAHHLSFDVLSRLIERRAPPVEEAKAKRHLVSCGRCRSELAWLERIHSMPWRAGTSREDFELPAILGRPTVSRLDEDSQDPDDLPRQSRRSGSYWIPRPGGSLR
jgi:hypothetical protein